MNIKTHQLLVEEGLVRKLFTLIIIILLLVGLGCTKGKYKQIISLNYNIEYKFGEPVKKLSDKIIQKYDNNGNEIEYAKYYSVTSLNNLSFVNKSKYDKNGKKIKLVRYESDGSRNWVEGGWPIPSLEQVYERIMKWRVGREFRNVPIVILHHVEVCEIIEEIPATGKRSCPR